MNIHCDGDTLYVTTIKELDTASADSFRTAVSAAWSDALRHIEVDLAETICLDSCGLGALAWLRKLVADRGGRVRLLNPTPSIQQILDLTRLYRLFDIVHREQMVAR